MSKVLAENLHRLLCSKHFPPFYETGRVTSTFPTGPYPEPDEISPRSRKAKSILILLPTYRLILNLSTFPFNFPPKILHAFIVLYVCFTCPVTYCG